MQTIIEDLFLNGGAANAFIGEPFYFQRRHRRGCWQLTASSGVGACLGTFYLEARLHPDAVWAQVLDKERGGNLVELDFSDATAAADFSVLECEVPLLPQVRARTATAQPTNDGTVSSWLG